MRPDTAQGIEERNAAGWQEGHLPLRPACSSAAVIVMEQFGQGNWIMKKPVAGPWLTKWPDYAARAWAGQPGNGEQGRTGSRFLWFVWIERRRGGIGQREVGGPETGISWRPRANRCVDRPCHDDNDRVATVGEVAAVVRRRRGRTWISG